MKLSKNGIEHGSEGMMVMKVANYLVSRLEQDVVIFQDSQQQYEFGVTLPLRNQAGMSDSGQESIWDIQTAYNVVSGSVAN